MAVRGCTRCGGYHMLQVTHVEVGGETEEIRLCQWCRRKAFEETQAALERSTGADPTDAT